MMGVTRDPLLTRLPSRLDSCQSSRRFFGFVKLRPVRVVPDVERRSAPCVMAALASVVHHRHALPVPRTTTARTINKGKFMAATADPRQPKSNRGPHERPLNAGHYQAANRANCAPAGLPGAFFEPKVIHRGAQNADAAGVIARAQELAPSDRAAIGHQASTMFLPPTLAAPALRSPAKSRIVLPQDHLLAAPNWQTPCQAGVRRDRL